MISVVVCGLEIALGLVGSGFDGKASHDVIATRD